MSQLNVYEVLDALDGVREVSRGKWVARCPLHDDTAGALSVRAGARAAVLLQCFGCYADFRDLIRAVEGRAMGVGR